MSEPGAKAQRCPSDSLPEVAALIRFARSTATAAFALAAFAAAAIDARPVFAQSQPPPATGPGTNGSSPVTAPLGAPTPIPVLAAPTDEPVPGTSASAAPEGRHRRSRRSNASASPGPATPEPTPTPTAPGFATLDGTWEVQLQHPDSTDYSYLTIKQAATVLSGSWKVKKATYPFSDGDCTFDGKLVRIVTKTATGTVTFSGYVENGTDMVGTVDFGDKTDPVPFTAGHRGKDKGLFGPGISPAGLPLPGGQTYPH